jgi:hypothetical protein
MRTRPRHGLGGCYDDETGRRRDGRRRRRETATAGDGDGGDSIRFQRVVVARFRTRRDDEDEDATRAPIDPSSSTTRTLTRPTQVAGARGGNRRWTTTRAYPKNEGRKEGRRGA